VVPEQGCELAKLVLILPFPVFDILAHILHPNIVENPVFMEGKNKVKDLRQPKTGNFLA
jgi:hypothetical protein